MSILDNLSADAYHADIVADRPTLSASIAHVLTSQSPAHARAAHPRLNPNYQRVDDPKFSIGNACHAMILEGRDAVELIHHGDYRSNAAKEDRDAALAAGKIPLLVHVKAEVDAMVDAVREQLAAHTADPPLFTDGKPEQTLVWDEDGVACRARLDWLRDDATTIDDLKTTSRSANPDAYSRALFGVGGDIQAAFYLRGLAAVAGVPVAGMADFRWCVVETSPPFALSVISPGPDILALADAKVDYAINLWRECLRLDEWPAYPNRVATADLPAWEEARWMEKTMREAA